MNQIIPDLLVIGEWIVEFEKIANKRKVYVLEENECLLKDQTDCVWMIWDAILFQTTKRKSHLTKLVRALLELFTLRYTHGCKKKRRYMMYFAVSLLTEQVDTAGINIR